MQYKGIAIWLPFGGDIHDPHIVFEDLISVINNADRYTRLVGDALNFAPSRDSALQSVFHQSGGLWTFYHSWISATARVCEKA